MSDLLIKTQCAGDCEQDTNHHVLYKKRLEISHKKYRRREAYTEYQDYMTIQCAGCDTISFVIRSSDSDKGMEDGALKFYDDNYPDVGRDWSPYEFLQWETTDELPPVIEDLYLEVRGCFEKESEVLAGIGLRTLIEAICLDQDIPGNNLKQKIDNLHTQGLISEQAVPILHKLRHIGNFSAHEIRKANLDNLNYALKIINQVLEWVYILPRINESLDI